jgi:hypothetical protein
MCITEDKLVDAYVRSKLLEVGLRLFCPLPFFKHVLEKWHPIIYNNFCYRIVTLGGY